MDKLKKIFTPDKGNDGSDVQFGTPEPKNIHPASSDDSGLNRDSLADSSGQAPEMGMGTNQVSGEDTARTGPGNSAAYDQGPEAGLGTRQVESNIRGSNPSAYNQAPESGLGTTQTGREDYADDVRAQGPEAGLGRTQQDGMGGGGQAPEAGMGTRQTGDERF